MKYFTYFFLLTVISILHLQCTKTDSASANTFAGNGGTGTGGSTARFTIVGNYLYTVDKQNLKVFSLSNLADPVLKNTVSIETHQE